jgi:hypothetical protein
MEKLDSEMLMNWHLGMHLNDDLKKQPKTPLFELPKNIYSR